MDKYRYIMAKYLSPLFFISKAWALTIEYDECTNTDCEWWLNSLVSFHHQKYVGSHSFGVSVFSIQYKFAFLSKMLYAQLASLTKV